MKYTAYTFFIQSFLGKTFQILSNLGATDHHQEARKRCQGLLGRKCQNRKEFKSEGMDGRNTNEITGGKQ